VCRFDDMAAPSTLNPSSDASYLRRLFERQSACLIRVRLDGVLLACNRAALALFGVDALRAVLSTNLVDRIVLAQRPQWQEFMRRCWEKGAASFECDLVIRNNEARPVLVQGVALKDYPDGFESLLLHLCDQSQPPRLEHSIPSIVIDRLDSEERQRAGRDQITEGSGERLEVGVPVDEDRAERRRLIEALEAQSADRQHRKAKLVELEKKLEESRSLSLQKEREHGRDVAMLKSALAAAHAAKTTAVAEKQDLEALKLRLQTATAEQVRLDALVAEYEVDRTRTAADHRAVVDTLEQSLAQALAEQRRMVARVEEQTREHDLMRAGHQRALVDLQASNDAALADVRSQLARTSAGLAERVEVAERELDLLRAEHERAHERLIAEHRRALADMETGKREALAELRSQLSQAFDDQRRLAARADEQELELDRLRAEHYAALTDVQTRNRDVLAELRSELAQTAAEHTRILAERAEEHERERNRLSAENSLAIADLQAKKKAAAAELRSQLSAAVAEHHSLTALLEDGDRERERMAAEHRRTIADLQASKHETVAECERVLTEVQQALLMRDASRCVEIERRLVDGINAGPLTKGDRERLASLQRGLTLAFSRMHAVLKDRAASKEPFEVEHHALERPRIETID
jgi:PAS domain-containing protein